MKTSNSRESMSSDKPFLGSGCRGSCKPSLFPHFASHGDSQDRRAVFRRVMISVPSRTVNGFDFLDVPRTATTPMICAECAVVGNGPERARRLRRARDDASRMTACARGKPRVNTHKCTILYSIILRV